jgi:O-antigen ligase
MLAAGAGFTLSAAVAAADGGYFPETWSWVSLASLLASAVRLLVVPAHPLRRLDWALLAGLYGFTAWVAVSTLWSPSPTAALDEATRAFAYAAAVGAVLLLVRREAVAAFLGGVLGGIVVISTYALLTRLLPDRVGAWDPAVGYRLSEPIGYWNGLGLYATLGTLLALGLATHARSHLARALAGAAPVVLLPTALFTFSRGVWLALCVGAVVALASEPCRRRLLLTSVAIVPWPALALVFAWQYGHLTDRTLTIDQAADEGGRMLVVVLLLALTAGVVTAAAGTVGDRLPRSASGRGRSRAVAAGTAATVVLVVTLVASSATPWAIADQAWRAVDAPPQPRGEDVSGRLFDPSSNGRIDLWRVSLHQFREQPLQGAGAGSYVEAWTRERPAETAAHDAHSLFVETLGELGLVGLALLLAGLAVPLLAALPARRGPLSSCALAVYAAFLVHASIDRDWELPGVTLVALAAGASLVVAARADGPPARRRIMVRVALPAVSIGLALVALGSVAVNTPLARARKAYERLDFTQAAAEARRARDRAPWSSNALKLLARAELSLGHRRRARTILLEAVTKSPGDWELWRDLASASQPRAAMAALDHALALNPRENELEALRRSLDAEPELR